MAWPTARGTRALRRLLSSTTPPLPGPLRAVAESLGIADHVDIVATGDAFAVTYGLLRPRILFSTGLVGALDMAELTAVLVHERHHLRRRDPLRLLATRVAAAYGWYLPLLSWWARRLALRRELAADRLAEADTRRGRPPTPGTLHRIRATLRAALNAAVREGLRSDNPARHIELPGPRRPHAEVWTNQRITAWREQGQRPIVAVWTAQQLAAFLATIADDPLYPMWWLIALRGLRRGEAAGLRWCDIDLNAGTITIEQQRIAYGRTVYVGPPKTAASRRTIALDRATVRLMRDHRSRQQAERDRACQQRQDSGNVFTATDGSPLQTKGLAASHRLGCGSAPMDHGVPLANASGIAVQPRTQARQRWPYGFAADRALSRVTSKPVEQTHGQGREAGVRPAWETQRCYLRSKTRSKSLRQVDP